VAVNRV